MKKDDLIKVVYTEEELNALESNLAQLEQFAKKFAPNLSAEDRVSYGSIKEINKLFVNKSKTLMEQNSNLCPRFIDIDEFNRDFKARKTIDDLLLRIERLVRDFTDTKTLLDNDNYQDSLAFYRSVRYWANEQEDGAIAVYDQLRPFFPNSKSKSKSEPTNNAE